MGVRLQNDSISLNGGRYRVSIIDLEYSGSVELFNMTKVLFKSTGDAKDMIKPVSMGALDLSLWIDNAAVEAFVSDVEEAEESRFYVKVERNDGGFYSTEFTGMILTDSIGYDDSQYALLQLNAVDGLGFLKDVEFEWGSTDYYYPMWKILHTALVKNPIVTNLYGDSDIVMVCQSNIQMNINDFESIFLNLGHINYYFDIKGEIRTNWTCYEVIEEILKKYTPYQQVERILSMWMNFF